MRRHGISHRAAAGVGRRSGHDSTRTTAARFDNGETRLWIWSPSTGARSIPLPIVGAQPSPSPDGKRIAFAGKDDANDIDIYVMNRNGSNMIRLTHASSIDDQPAWSPDGTRIAYRSTFAGASDVWMMNADGTNAKRLTPNGGNHDARISEDQSEHPAWSPDGQRIAYSRTIGIGRWIEVMNADGTKRRELTRSAFDNEPAWSPDGNVITFARRRAGQAEPIITSVYVASGEPILGITQPGTGSTPDYSADGRWLVREGAITDYRWRGALVLPLSHSTTRGQS